MESSIPDPESTKQRLQINQEILNVLSKINISNKLTDNNYILWSQAIIISLRSIDLDEYLKSDTPNSEIFSPLYHSAIKRLLSSWIFSQLDPLQHLTSQLQIHYQPGTSLMQNPAAIWPKLKELRMKYSSRNIFYLNKQLNTLKQGPNTLLREHLDKFKMIKSQILQAGAGIDKDSGLLYTLLESIHPRFNSKRGSIARFFRPLTYEKVFEELLEKQKCALLLSSLSYTLDAYNKANAAQKTRIKCTKDQCLSPLPSNLCHAKNEASRRAWIKKKIAQGLWRRDVPKWYKSKPSSQSNLATVLKCPVINNPICYFGKEGKNEDTIIFETGAMQHMFNNVKYFEPETVCNNVGLKLKLAGGGVTLPVQGIGLAIVNGHNNHKMVFEKVLYVPQLSKNLIAGCILLQDSKNILKTGSMVELKDKDNTILCGKFCNNLMEFTAQPKTARIG